MQQEMERRSFRRLSFQAPAFVNHEDKTIYGEVGNISNMGMFLRTKWSTEVNQQVFVSIYFLGHSSTLSVTLPVTIVRQGDDGLGVHSPHINANMLLHLEGLLACYSQDSRQLMDEFNKTLEFRSGSMYC